MYTWFITTLVCYVAGDDNIGSFYLSEIPSILQNVVRPNGQPVWDKGVLGNGEIIAVVDDAIDKDSCFFTDFPEAVDTDTEPLKQPRTSRRKLIQVDDSLLQQPPTNYAAITVRLHGTFVASIIAGLPVSLDKNAIYSDLGEITGPGMVLTDPAQLTKSFTGMAPKAKILFKKLQVNNEGQPMMPQYSSYLTGLTLSNVGAVVCAWGSQKEIPKANQPATDGYHVLDFTVDHHMFTNPLAPLPIFAVGQRTIGRGLKAYPAHPAQAKNALSVGSTTRGSNEDGTISYRLSDTVATLTWDGRYKPEIVAPGEFVQAADWASGEEQCKTTVKSGTSASAAIVGGAVALLREYLRRGLWAPASSQAAAIPNPDSALIKALLILSARPLREESGHNQATLLGPQPGQGFGLLDLSEIMYIDKPNDPAEHKNLYFNREKQNDGSWDIPRLNKFRKDDTTAHTSCIKYHGSKHPLKILLYWHDPAPPSNTKVEDVKYALQFDLDLIVWTNGATWKGNLKSDGTWDNRNNAEIVILENAPAGYYKIQVIFNPQYNQRRVGGDDILELGYTLAILGNFELSAHFCNANLPDFPDPPACPGQRMCNGAGTCTGNDPALAHCICHDTRRYYHVDCSLRPELTNERCKSTCKSQNKCPSAFNLLSNTECACLSDDVNGHWTSGNGNVCDKCKDGWNLDTNGKCTVPCYPDLNNMLVAIADQQIVSVVSQYAVDGTKMSSPSTCNWADSKPQGEDEWICVSSSSAVRIELRTPVWVNGVTTVGNGEDSWVENFRLDYVDTSGTRQQLTTKTLSGAATETFFGNSDATSVALNPFIAVLTKVIIIIPTKVKGSTPQFRAWIAGCKDDDEGRGNKVCTPVETTLRGSTGTVTIPSGDGSSDQSQQTTSLVTFYQCACPTSNNIYDPNVGGVMCRQCEESWSGEQCKCRFSCSGHGICNPEGCLCYDDDIRGHWTSRKTAGQKYTTACDTCRDGWAGAACKCKCTGTACGSPNACRGTNSNKDAVCCSNHGECTIDGCLCNDDDEKHHLGHWVVGTEAGLGSGIGVRDCNACKEGWGVINEDDVTQAGCRADLSLCPPTSPDGTEHGIAVSQGCVCYANREFGFWMATGQTWNDPTTPRILRRQYAREGMPLQQTYGTNCDLCYQNGELDIDFRGPGMDRTQHCRCPRIGSVLCENGDCTPSGCVCSNFEKTGFWVLGEGGSKEGVQYSLACSRCHPSFEGPRGSKISGCKCYRPQDDEACSGHGRCDLTGCTCDASFQSGYWGPSDRSAGRWLELEGRQTLSVPKPPQLHTRDCAQCAPGAGPIGHCKCRSAVCSGHGKCGVAGCECYQDSSRGYWTSSVIRVTSSTDFVDDCTACYGDYSLTDTSCVCLHGTNCYLFKVDKDVTKCKQARQVDLKAQPAQEQQPTQVNAQSTPTTGTAATQNEETTNNVAAPQPTTVGPTAPPADDTTPCQVTFKPQGQDPRTITYQFQGQKGLIANSSLDRQNSVIQGQYGVDIPVITQWGYVAESEVGNPSPGFQYIPGTSFSLQVVVDPATQQATTQYKGRSLMNSLHSKSKWRAVQDNVPSASPPTTQQATDDGQSTPATPSSNSSPTTTLSAKELAEQKIEITEQALFGKDTSYPVFYLNGLDVSLTVPTEGTVELLLYDRRKPDEELDAIILNYQSAPPILMYLSGGTWRPVSDTCSNRQGVSSNNYLRRERDPETNIRIFKLGGTICAIRGKTNYAVFAPRLDKDLFWFVFIIAMVAVAVVFLIGIVVFFVIFRKLRKEKRLKKLKESVIQYIIDRRQNVGTSLRARLRLKANETFTSMMAAERFLSKTRKTHDKVERFLSKRNYTALLGSSGTDAKRTWEFRDHEVEFLEACRKVRSVFEKNPFTPEFEEREESQSELTQGLQELNAENEKLKRLLLSIKQSVTQKQKQANI